MPVELPDINKRVKFLIQQYAQGNYSKFCKIIQIKNHNQITRLFRLNSSSNNYPLPSADIIYKIAKYLVEVDLNWLISGQGNYLKSEFQHTINTIDLNTQNSIVSLVRTIVSEELQHNFGEFQTIKRLLKTVDQELEKKNKP